MESIYGQHEEYYGRCGEIFLTVKGNVAFHCTLCENRYKTFCDYNDHILEHYEDYRSEHETDSINIEDSPFDPLKEESFSINSEDFLIKEATEIETYVSPEEIYEASFEDIKISSLDEQFELSSQDFPHPSNLTKREASVRKLRSINVKPTIKDRKYKCPHCDYTGADKSNMRSHIRRHSTYKPYKCTECGKAFHTRTELNTHVRSHTGERPFLCTICGRTYSTSSKLSNHKKRHDDVRSKECAICKMRFYDGETLRGHMATHSETRNYKCEYCDASFKLPLALRNHRKLHENKREYQCKLCDSRFNQHAGLYSHMKCCHTIVFNSSKNSPKIKFE